MSNQFKEPMDYHNICDGAANEMFERELERILKNIKDVNTPYKDKREINIKFVFRADEDRDRIDIECTVSSKAPGFRSYKSMAHIGVDPADKSKWAAYENSHPDQRVMSFTNQAPSEPTGAAIPFKTDERKAQ